MNCPYCGKEMQQGAVVGRRDPFAWYPGNGDWLMGSNGRVRLCKTEMFEHPRAKSFFCADCRMIIMPVPEIEEPLDAVKNKLKGLKDRA